MDSLAGNDSIGWRFMSRTRDQRRGVRRILCGTRHSDDFSRDMMSVLTPEMVRPELEYYVNEKEECDRS